MLFCKPIHSSLVSSLKRNPAILNSKFNSLYEVEVFFSFLPLFHWKRLLACRIPSALVLYRINVLVEPPYATDPQYLLRWSRCLSSYPPCGLYSLILSSCRANTSNLLLETFGLPHLQINFDVNCLKGFLTLYENDWIKIQKTMTNLLPILVLLGQIWFFSPYRFLSIRINVTRI